MRKMIKTALLTALALLAGSYPHVEADTQVTVSGYILGKEVLRSSTGSVRQITLTVSSQDGGYWPVRCTRDDGNLGKCDNWQEGDSVVVFGSFRYDNVSIGCGWIYPDSIQSISQM